MEFLKTNEDEGPFSLQSDLLLCCVDEFVGARETIDGYTQHCTNVTYISK
jgi:hypothetical protein